MSGTEASPKLVWRISCGEHRSRPQRVPASPPPPRRGPRTGSPSAHRAEPGRRDEVRPPGGRSSHVAGALALRHVVAVPRLADPERRADGPRSTRWVSARQRLRLGQPRQHGSVGGQVVEVRRHARPAWRRPTSPTCRRSSRPCAPGVRVAARPGTRARASSTSAAGTASQPSGTIARTCPAVTWRERGGRGFDRDGLGDEPGVDRGGCVYTRRPRGRSPNRR